MNMSVLFSMKPNPGIVPAIGPPNQFNIAILHGKDLGCFLHELRKYIRHFVSLRPLHQIAFAMGRSPELCAFCAHAARSGC
jgi:hypothetical protein